MLESRWILRLGGPALGLVVVGVLATVSSAAGMRASGVPSCIGVASLPASLDEPPPAGPAGLEGDTWYRLDPVLDEGGRLVGQRLVAGLHGRTGDIAIDLPPESFAAGPFGSLVLYGGDDGQRSELSLLDPVRGCRAWAGTASAVIRSATIDPSGTAIYEHRVARATRADLGIFRRPITGGAAEPVVPALAPDDRFGPTFATQLSWDGSGGRLAIHACGAVQCRLRSYDPSTGRTMPGGQGVGPLVGVADGRAIVYDRCLGLPCPILSLDLASGRRQELGSEAGVATIAMAEDGARVVHQTPGGGIRIVGIDGSHPVTFTLPSGTPRLMPSAPGMPAGIRVPPGWLVITDETPTGRPDPGAAVLFRLRDGTTADPSEVTR